MKSDLKRNLLFLLNFVIIFFLCTLYNNRIDLNSNYNDNRLENTNKFNLDNENLHLSKISWHIHIDDNDPVRNWSVAMDAGICTGNGTYTEPYVIEDFVIDGGNVGSCIWIENSNVYFRIENCSLTNSAELSTQAGIKLYNVNNSLLINNTCSFNDNGIRADYCNNNTICGNKANNNENLGIFLYNCNNNSITSNVANNNNLDGIRIHSSKNNSITKNNLSYDKGVGIVLFYADNNTVTGNTAHTNTIINTIGIYLFHSEYNIITGNLLIGNGECILEDTCYGNFFEYNNCINNIQEERAIFVSYVIMILIIISFVAIIIGLNMKLIPRNS